MFQFKAFFFNLIINFKMQNLLPLKPTNPGKPLLRQHKLIFKRPCKRFFTNNIQNECQR